MTETIQTAMDRLMTISVEPQDYVAEDGLLYCGSCKTPKEAFFPNGKKLFGRDRHPAECRCRQATREKQEKEERARLHEQFFFRQKIFVHRCRADICSVCHFLQADSFDSVLREQSESRFDQLIFPSVSFTLVTFNVSWHLITPVLLHCSHS